MKVSLRIGYIVTRHIKLYMEAKKKDSAGRHMIPGPNRGPIFFVKKHLRFE
ncbi:hypothetical protein Lalb_Chr12g0196711 [Lupinus albus]|uniref:Uncharacterized protein n=1 Tax=Lupinus albus TaxID=3870 RepID=A0A6A4PL12_LUPAL|nr:hypothetical protein Lalb_Chr12g0196711 [Lupinus albus]